MKHFDRANLQSLRTEIDAALAAVAARHPGLSFTLGSARFTPTTVNFKFSAALVAEDKLDIPGCSIPASHKWRMDLAKYGKIQHLGEKTMTDRGEGVVVGFKPGRGMKPHQFIVEINGKFVALNEAVFKLRQARAQETQEKAAPRLPSALERMRS